MYTEDNSVITKENIIQVILAADFFQFAFIGNPNFVRSDLISKENVIEVMEVARRIDSDHHLKKQALHAIGQPETLEELLLYARCIDDRNLCLKYLKQDYYESRQLNFLEVINHPYFLLVDDAIVTALIIDPLFAKKKEWHIEIFRAILKWIRFKKGREIHADNLLRSVWIDTLPQDILKNEVLPAVKEIPACKWFIQQVTEYTESTHEIPCFQAMISIGPGYHGNRYIRHRIPQGYVQPVMYVFGGEGHTIDGTIADGFAFCQEITDPEDYDEQGPRPEGHTHDLAYWPLQTGLGLMEPKGDIAGCFAFIAGGYTQDQNKSMTPSDQFVRYQMITGEKVPLPNLPKATYWHEVVVHHDRREVWVLGGVVQDGGKNVVTRSTYIYNTTSNSWKSGPDLPELLCQFGACCTPTSRWEFHLVDTPRVDILISGGTTIAQGRKLRSSVTSTSYVYNTEAASWEKLPDMNNPRYGHSMASFCDDDDADEYKKDVYVVGGRGKDEQYLESIEIYQMDLRQWTVLTHPSFKRAMFGIFTRRWKAELITFCEDDDGQTVMQIMSSLPEIHQPYWNDVATLKLVPFSVKGTLILPCIEELRLEDPPLGVTVNKVACSTCNVGPSAYYLAD